MALGRDLPDDLVADVLRRLPPRSLAVSRCACRAWRDLVDGRRLLRADLLPRAVAGIFLHYDRLFSSEFLARPTTKHPSAAISGDMELIIPTLDFISQVLDHCNGLLLCTNYKHEFVINPATRRWAMLPPKPGHMRLIFREALCLVHDPTLSPHYHVLFLIGSSSLDQQNSALRGCVYSSETGRWEDMWFAPEVPAVVQTTIVVALEDDMPHNRVYWRGRLYLLCQRYRVLRISISDATYKLFRLPAAVKPGYPSLGRSEKGIYCASEYRYLQLKIFLLNESCGQVVWELKHSVDLATFAHKLRARENNRDRPSGPWVLEDINYYKSPDGNGKRREAVEDNYEWNSDDDNVLNTEAMVEGRYKGYITLLGFHPYKEVVFLNADLSRAVAYHWNTSKFQDLGNISPTDYRDIAGSQASIDASFIYTPCWMDNFPKK